MIKRPLLLMLLVFGLLRSQLQRSKELEQTKKKGGKRVLLLLLWQCQIRLQVECMDATIVSCPQDYHGLSSKSTTRMKNFSMGIHARRFECRSHGTIDRYCLFASAFFPLLSLMVSSGSVPLCRYLYSRHGN
jgi:hypothetical protein